VLANVKATMDRHEKQRATVTLGLLQTAGAINLTLPQAQPQWWSLGGARDVMRMLTDPPPGSPQDRTLDDLRAVNALLLIGPVLYADLLVAYTEKRTPTVAKVDRLTFYYRLVRPLTTLLGDLASRDESTGHLVLDARTIAVIRETLRTLLVLTGSIVEDMPDDTWTYLEQLRPAVLASTALPKSPPLTPEEVEVSKRPLLDLFGEKPKPDSSSETSVEDDEL
jgi:hypothetical protein